MATSQQFLVCDSSTLANFKQWAQAISAFFTTAGWSQSADTGQVNWSTVSVPGSGAFVYEIWQPNDGLTTFYTKVEYGFVSGTNTPSLRISISATTNGSGTLTGTVLGPMNVNQTTFVAPSTTTTYECNFSGAPGRMCVMMWRNAPANQGQEMFAIERSLNSSGAATSTYVTLWVCGFANSNRQSIQGTLVFGVGIPNFTNGGISNQGGWIVRVQQQNGAALAFNGSIPFDTCTPCIGFYDYSCTVVGAVSASGTTEIAEGVTFNATVYGSTRTYMPSKIGPFNGANPENFPNVSFLCMRYD